MKIMPPQVPMPTAWCLLATSKTRTAGIALSRKFTERPVHF